MKKLLLILFFVLLVSLVLVTVQQSFAQGLPVIQDSNFKVELVASGLSIPTTMTFVGSDILVLEKNSGKVRLVRDGELQENSILDLDVFVSNARGLLGITSIDSTVYLDYMQTPIHIMDQENPDDDDDPVRNVIYKYIWDGQTLINPILVKDLPADDNHVGGAMVTNSIGDVFVIRGDLHRLGPLQNFPTGEIADSGVILHVNFDESVLTPSQSVNPLEHYVAMGIRNSFGLAVDPINGNLWATENGPNNFDEINLAEPNFNSGWRTIKGPATAEQISSLPVLGDFTYSDPEFSWFDTVAPTAISFINSQPFADYANSVFVGGFKNGNLYTFELNNQRTGFVFQNPDLADLVLDACDNPNEIIFGTGFGGISDIEVGPDGFLYILSVGSGEMYKISPNTPSPTEKLLEVRGLATNPNNDGISYKVVVIDSIRKGPAANPNDVISADGETLNGRLKPQAGRDNYFVTGDIVSVEAPVNLAVTLDGVSIPVITLIPIMT